MTTQLEKVGEQVQVSTLAKVLFLIGGILLIVSGTFRIIDMQTLFDLTPTVRNIATLTGLTSGVLAIVVGIASLFGMRQVKSPAWNIALMILGLIVSSLGGILVFLASIIGLVAIYVKQ